MSQLKYVKLTDEQVRARKRRNVAIALGLLGFIALVYLVTLSRMSANNEARKAAEADARDAARRAEAENAAKCTENGGKNRRI